MSKPINVEAQRVHKVIAETSDKIKVLSMLNQEFFEEIREEVKKKDSTDILNHFGPKLGKLLLKHADLEEKFNSLCVEDGIKMTPLESEFISEEARQCALELRNTTAKLIREFSIQEN